VSQIGKHISELLFDHDCVIVPALGGFLASNESSRILLPNHIIFPPYRRIAFNVYLKKNDGLLANYIVSSEKIPYSEANRLIESFAAECFENLNNGRKVSITEVGMLYYDKERNIQFEAFRNFNHLKESFGMESVHFLPINREDKIETRKQPSEKIIRPSVPHQKERVEKVNNKKNKRYLSAAILGAALVWVGLNVYLVAPKKYESTSLSPFDSQSIVLSKSDSMRNIPAQTEKFDSAISAVNKKDTVSAETTASVIENKTEESVMENSPGNVIVQPPPVVTQPVEEKQESSGKKHYLIAGVFKVKENADGLLLHLKQLGFSNAQLIEANGMHYVSYNDFSNSAEALSLVDSLHNKNLDGWIWNH
jgi:cell division protein FtsN